jgi:hypothetical protein
MPKNILFDKSITLSANTLFHFTRSIENIIGILTNDFIPHYSLENFSLEGTDTPEDYRAIPMVSFCDIPLSQIRNHVKHYGHYALGLTKEWARSRGISPVIYTYPTALSMLSILEIMTSMQKAKSLRRSGLKHIDYLCYFLKQYEGKIYRDGKFSDEVVRFYDEREWRFVPPLEILMSGNVNSLLYKEDYDDKKLLELQHQKLADVCPLAFSPRYIRYVIVENESERLHMMDRILSIKGPNHLYDEVRALTSRIISLEQIIGDF